MLANIEIVFGVFDILLRLLGVAMAMLVVFLYTLQNSAARTPRNRAPEAPPVLRRPQVAEPAPFVLRSSRESTLGRDKRAA